MFLPLRVISKAGKTAPFLRILFHGIIMYDDLVKILWKDGIDRMGVGRTPMSGRAQLGPTMLFTEPSNHGLVKSPSVPLRSGIALQLRPVR